MRVSMIAFDHGEAVVPLAAGMARRVPTQLILPEDQFAQATPLDDDAQFITFSKPRLRDPVRQLRLGMAIVRAVRAFDPDIVHVQQGHLWFNWFMPLLRSSALVITVHDVRPHPGDRGAEKTPPFVHDVAYRQADVVITHATHVMRELAESVPSATTNVHVVPLAFADRARAAPAPSAPPAPSPSPFTILFFGRIWPYKGLDHLINAEPYLHKRIAEYKVVIAGTGEPFARYRHMMTHPEQFEVINAFVSVEQRDRLFAQADVVVLPYVEATQTGVIPLAYRSGTPVVATTVGGLPEVVEHERTGLLVPPADPRALADAIVRLAEDEDLRVDMSCAARTAFKTTFDLDRIVDKTYAAYREAVGS